MLKNVLLFLFGNLLFVSLVIVVCEIGYQYDKTHKLQPELKELSYDLSMQVYGERWVRLGKFMFGLGVVTDAALLMIWYRNRQKNPAREFL
jgi:hypothetical protein